MTDFDRTLSELTALPVADRLRVVESLWDSIPVETPLPISPEQREDIRRRIAAYERAPTTRSRGAKSSTGCVTGDELVGAFSSGSCR